MCKVCEAIDLVKNVGKFLLTEDLKGQPGLAIDYKINEVIMLVNDENGKRVIFRRQLCEPH